ncbi:hypothetical protein PVAG01_07773 [Phlyctema vagabunda]|uniref:Uncharacterized protein n=1 Tax=Phlyctema vagabunda TaxID=108571 RepID=A0ABR4PDF7_9HELO
MGQLPSVVSHLHQFRPTYKSHVCAAGEVINWTRDCGDYNPRSFAYAFAILIIPTFAASAIVAGRTRQPDLERGLATTQTSREVVDKSLLYPGRVLFTGMGFNVIMCANPGARDAATSIRNFRASFERYREPNGERLRYTRYKEIIHKDEDFTIHVLADPGDNIERAEAFANAFKSRSRRLHLRRRIQELPVIPAAHLARHHGTHLAPPRPQDASPVNVNIVDDSDQQSLDALITTVQWRG